MKHTLYSIHLFLFLSVLGASCSEADTNIRANESSSENSPKKAASASEDETSQTSETVGDEALVLPYQTTGMYLSGECKWSRRGGFDKNAVKCRFENDEGIKLEPKASDVLVKYKGNKIDAEIEVLAAEDYWSIISKFSKKYMSDITVELVSKDGKNSSFEAGVFQFTGGVHSVRKTPKSFQLSDVFSGIAGGANPITGVMATLGGNQEIEMRSFEPEVLCNANGDNKMITDEMLGDPAFASLEKEHSRYYWDPIKLYETAMNKAGIGNLSSVLKNQLEEFTKSSCEGVVDALGNIDYTGYNCNKNPEVQLDKPIESSGEYCLHTLRKLEQNEKRNESYCNTVVFERKNAPASENSYYVMGLGNQRINDIASQVPANNKHEALTMYMESFEKCPDFTIENYSY